MDFSNESSVVHLELEEFIIVFKFYQNLKTQLGLYGYINGEFFTDEDFTRYAEIPLRNFIKICDLLGLDRSHICMKTYEESSDDSTDSTDSNEHITNYYDNIKQVYQYIHRNYKHMANDSFAYDLLSEYFKEVNYPIFRIARLSQLIAYTFYSEGIAIDTPLIQKIKKRKNIYGNFYLDIITYDYNTIMSSIKEKSCKIRIRYSGENVEVSMSDWKLIQNEVKNLKEFEKLRVEPIKRNFVYSDAFVVVTNIM